MNILIAGGSGLIGQALAKHATSAGHDVAILTRKDARMASGRTVPWDGVNPGPWVQEIESADAIVNLCGASAGDGRWTDKRKQLLRESRLVPSRLLVRNIAESDRQPTYVQASAVGYYGTGVEPRHEGDPAGRDFLAELSVDWEACAHDCSARTIIARFGVALARNGGALPRMLLPFRLFAGGELGSGHQWLSWIHVGDAARAIMHCIEGSLTGPVNIVAPNAVTNQQFSSAAASALNRPNALRMPAFALRLILGEAAVLALDGQRVVPGQLTASGFEFEFPCIEEALADLTH